VGSKKHLKFVFVLILLLPIVFFRGKVSAQTEESRFFPETGHYVEGEFLKFFLSVKNPLELYGYPITDAFQDSKSGLRVQYFQRVRLELWPDLQTGSRVEITRTGPSLYQPGKPLPLLENGPACRLYEETGFQVCYSFLTFFDANGGVKQFGYPISPLEDHDGRMVQYFERARMEWHPEFPSGHRIVLANLGILYFDYLKEDQSKRISDDGNNLLLDSITNLKVSVFSEYSVKPLEGEQTVYVIVQDQNYSPVQGAAATLVVSMPSGEQGRYIMPSTDSHGITSYTFPFSSSDYGLVKVSATASFLGLQKQSFTAFRLWW
jgi:hypothetical protein